MKICPGFTSKSWLIHKVGFLEKQDKEMKDNGIGTIEAYEVALPLPDIISWWQPGFTSGR